MANTKTSTSPSNTPSPSPDRRNEIHISELKTFLGCERQWDFSSITRMNLEPAVPYAPFFTGRAVHWCIQQYYENHVHPSITLPLFLNEEQSEMERHGVQMQPELWEQETTLLEGMLNHYVAWATRESGRWSDKNLSFIALETEFNLPLFPGSKHPQEREVRMAGRFDGVVYHPESDSFWLWEVKTSARPESLAKSLPFDLQPSVYIWAAEQIFEKKIHGVLYQVMRKKVPTYPRTLLNGTLSKDKRVDTTAHLYIEAAMELHSQDIPNEEERRRYILAEYGEVLEEIVHKDTTNPFFLRQPLRRTPQEINTALELIRHVSNRMLNTSRAIPTGMGIWGKCNNCAFRDPCLTMNAGQNPAPILEGNYRERNLWRSLEGDPYNYESE